MKVLNTVLSLTVTTIVLWACQVKSKTEKYAAFNYTFETSDKALVFNDSAGFLRVDLSSKLGFINDRMEAIDSVVYIALETNDACLLGKVEGVKVVGNQFFIQDRNGKAKRILRFDRQGRFLNKIGNVGDGPEAYRRLGYYSIDEKTKTVYIYDSSRDRMISYDFNGNYISEKRLNMGYIRGFEYENDRLYIFMNRMPYNDQHYNLWFRDTNNVLKGFFAFKHDENYHLGVGNPFYTVGDEMCYFDKWTSKVYTIKGDTVALRCHIDFGAHQVPIEYTANNTIYDQHKDDYWKIWVHFHENNHFIFFDYKTDTYQNCLIDKRTGKVYNYLPRAPIGSDMGALVGVVCAKDNFFVTISDIIGFVGLKKQLKSAHWVNLPVKEIVEKCTINDNPVIVMAYMK